MRRGFLLVLLPLLMVTACARTGPSASRPVADADLYSTVLRQYLSAPSDNSNLDFTTAFVLDHTEVDAADPMASPVAGDPISIADQHRIVAALADVTKVEFVSSRDQVTVKDSHGCESVRDHGILVQLGQPATVDGTTRIGINGFMACLGASWLTYVIVHDADGWTVTGTTGSDSVA